VAAVSIANTKKGRETNVAAIIAPAVVNGRVTPNQLSSFSPMKPFLPRANSKAVPPATGGRTIGSRTTARRIFKPFIWLFAKTHPRGSPNRKQIAAADVATINDSVIDRRTDSSVAISMKVDHGVLCDNPINGTIKNIEEMKAPNQRRGGIDLEVLIVNWSSEPVFL
jgi:hypothetical protein